MSNRDIRNLATFAIIILGMYFVYHMGWYPVIQSVLMVVIGIVAVCVILVYIASLIVQWYSRRLQRKIDEIIRQHNEQNENSGEFHYGRGTEVEN